MSKDKKIGLVTIHYANSYGGLLQAYASQALLSRYGCVEIIDYKTDHLKKTMRLVRFGDGPRGVLRAGKDFLRIFPRRKALKRFKDFIAKNFVLSDVCHGYEDVSSLVRQYDFLVSGSDQIWNPKVVDGLDRVYFLDFQFPGEKLSFASSMGSYRYTLAEQVAVARYLKDYKSLAVREGDTAEYLSDLIEGGAVETVVDPTLMLDMDDWRKVASDDFKPPFDEYVLIYTLKKNDFVRKVISEVSARLGLKVVAIDQDPYLGYSCDVHFNDIGPAEFLKLFLNAKFVVTNSFHGTAFALNFSKPFVSIEPESGRNRILGLLDKVDAKGKFVPDFESLDVAMSSELDWFGVQKKISSLRSVATDFLGRSLGG